MTQSEIWLTTIAKKNNVSITDIQLKRLIHYAELLLEWNKKINLVSRKDESNILCTHIMYSIAFLFKIDFINGCKIIDLGTGGGLPGIPLSIIMPDINFILLDSVRKKTIAVQEMLKTLGLLNVSVVCGRAEEICKLPKYKNVFDVVIAKSVSGLENLVAWGMPFLKPNQPSKRSTIGANEKMVVTSPFLITLKGGDISTEISRTLKRFPHVKIQWTDLVFKGSEDLDNPYKKLVFVENV